MFKPKFAPKVPVKSEPGEAQPATNTQTAPVEPSKNSKNEKDKVRVKKERDNDRDRNSQNRAGRGAGGRGPQWTMPAGAAFFTGNAPAQLAAKMNQSITIPVKTEAPKPSSSSVLRVARPNEVIDDDFPTQGMTSSSDFLQPEPDLEDTDSDRSDDDVAPVSSQLPEVWPPVKYNPLDPLSLPFGPKTAQLRKILAQEAILAPPDDLEALDYEERTSLFLLQMPSDLKAVTAGRLGKLQLLRSGKVRLVTQDGKSFDVKNGLAACFMQSIATVDVSQRDTNASTEGEHSATTKKKSKEVPVTSEQGTIHFMGNITKKLVLTPNYELGVQRKRSSSLSTQRAHRAAQEALGRARAGSEVVGGEEELLAEEEDFSAMDIMDVGE